MKDSEKLLSLIRNGQKITLGQQIKLTALLSVPAIIAQLSTILMQYIDASMVGSLGAGASASIGLVSTTTWLFSGLCMACATGFSVQVAHKIGARDYDGARSVLRQGIVAAVFFGLFMAAAGNAISGSLPSWLGGDESIRPDSSSYFSIYALFLPALQINLLGAGMLRCSGNMKVPSALNVMMCILDIIFNFFLIFPSREISLSGISVNVPGAGMGVTGAALGTGLAEAVTAVIMIWYLCSMSPQLRIARKDGSFIPQKETLRKAFKISAPMGAEHAVICGAQIMSTVIVAPLGIFAIAANSFAVTAESLCYMPGYGIGDAATTLVGQSIGASRKDLTRSFAWITVSLGIAVMSFMGAIMYWAAPGIIGIMTPVEEIRELGTMALRIEAFAEPMFAAAIVSYGVFVGAANTLVPCLMNFFSIWAVRLTLAAALAPSMGLKGVWIAMCIELCFRGIIFLIRLSRGKWMPGNS